MTTAGKIVVGNIEPIDFKRIRLSSLVKKRDEIKAPPDLDNPTTNALISQLPMKSYTELEAIARYLTTHSPSNQQVSSRQVDTWLALVTDELKKRDQDRVDALSALVAGKVSLIDFIKGGIK